MVCHDVAREAGASSYSAGLAALLSSTCWEGFDSDGWA